MPEIISRIGGPTIIYSEYVGTAFGAKKPTILQQIETAVAAAGHSYDFYTGDHHAGLERFLKKEVKVHSELTSAITVELVNRGWRQEDFEKWTWKIPNN